ncbi:MAG: hypothetical protein H6R04_22 [Burkholderiaceae bacterium]|nr:hypothetical protein [Burkholderiaceae bacterium]
MTDLIESSTALLLVAIVCVSYGIKLILFGGFVNSGVFIQIFGIQFGIGEREPMSTGQRWFQGLLTIGMGLILFHFYRTST